MDESLRSPVLSAVSSITRSTPSAAASAHHVSSSKLETTGSVLLIVLRFIPVFLLWAVTFTTVTLPTFLFTLTSTGLTITMNATTLILVALAVLSTISWFVRYRFLNMYTRLPPEPQRKEPQVELFPEVSEGDSKRGLSNYLDEFLSAIKVFGYLERPVFHELTRTMQTRKLIAGETILLEEEQGFCLVVDGLVQIFVKSSRDRKSESHSDESMNEDDEDQAHDHRQGYQLLTEVKNGAPLSSLFSILALFTEDVKLRLDDNNDPPSRPVSSAYHQAPNSSGPTSAHDSATFDARFDDPNEPNSPTRQRRYHHRQSSAQGFSSTDRGAPIPPFSLDGAGNGTAYTTRKHSRQDKPPKRRKLEPTHPNVVARATVDTTIAIIPATAFRRLTRTYPKASSHIVQVILTRLQRVTLSTGHAYLGLTSEVLNTEKLMNKFTTYDLPGFLRGSALERLKEKFSKEKETLAPEEGSKGIALHNPRAHLKPRSSKNMRKKALSQTRRPPSRDASTLPYNDDALTRLTSIYPDKGGVNAGDLLAYTSGTSLKGINARTGFAQPFQTISSGDDDPHPKKAPSSQSNPQTPFSPNRQENQDEDVFFRDSIVECMLKAIGLTDAQGTVQKAESVPQSPHLVSYDSRRQKAFFSNAFGMMDSLGTDADSESVTSIPASTVSASGSMSIQDELSNDVEIVFFPQGSVLVEQGERNPGLYYVIDGFLDVSVPEEGGTDSMSFADGPKVFDLAPPTSPSASQKSPSPQRTRPGLSRERASKRVVGRKSLYLTKPGGLAGYLGTISSRRSFVDITAKTDVYVGFLPRASIERIVEKYPIVLLTMAKRLTSLLPPLILHIDFALEWVQIDAGQAIFRQGDDSDAIYIVLNGRLRNLRTGSDGKTVVIGEYGQGDSVGELEVLTESPRPGTLHAIRDTELAKLPKTLFNSLALENPEITIKISKIIATRMRDLTEAPKHEGDHASTINGLATSTVNLRTVAILPVTAGVPVVEFGSRLLNALTQIGTMNGVTSLNQAAILNHLGRHAFSRMGKLKLSQHLADLEEKFGLVLYVADTNVNSPWTQTCISQADCILLVGVASGPHAIGEYERLLLTNKTTARKELVLLHPDRYCPPGTTRKWLRNRMWINGSHHHIHMPFHASTSPVHPGQARRFGTALKQRVQVLQAEIQKYTSRRIPAPAPIYGPDSLGQTPHKGDFHRLARRLVGKSVGLVLGGGGARGLAHIGIIRALEEAGIPIDIVGGTSIGAFVGALYAWDADLVPLLGRAKKFAGRMGSMWRFALDLTYPSAAYTTGHEFNRGIFKTFGTAQIEDFWLSFYCNTTNISASRGEVHTSGYAWRYVRASMTLAGLVPPLCDEGALLVDGGYLDNLTVTHMKSLGASTIFACDVGALTDTVPQLYGDSLSGLWSLLNRWNPFSVHANPPTLSEIQARLAYVSSVDALERAKIASGVRYMRPPVEGVGTLEFGRFEELVRVGGEYARGYLREMAAERDGGGIDGGGGGCGEGKGVGSAWGAGAAGADGGAGVNGAGGATEGLSGEEKRMRRTLAPRRASI